MNENTRKHIEFLLANDPEVDSQSQRRALALLDGKTRRQLIPSSEACSLLDNCHPITLRRLEKRDLLHPIRYSARKLMWDRQEILDFANFGIKKKENKND